MALQKNTKAILKRYAASKLGSEALSFPIELSDDSRTTVHLAAFDRAATAVRVAVMEEPEPLLAWCSRNQIFHAIVGGFFLRDQKLPAGEVWLRGRQVETFLGPWAVERGTLSVEHMNLRIAPRKELPHRPTGDLIQAGPTLVADGKSQVYPGASLEGFPKTWQRTNDTDITQGRYQRSAIGLSKDRIWVLAADGQHTDMHQSFDPGSNSGLDLEELAEIMVRLGCREALNLDGGGSTSLVYRGRLVNRPLAGVHDDQESGTVLPEGRRVYSAVAFLQR